MKRYQKAILLVATATLGVLLWKIDRAAVWRHLTMVGWGLALIFAQEIVAHSVNAVAWRFAFTRRGGDGYSFTELLKLRVAGDGINYLTPSATIAGEFVRAASLNESETSETRYASVAVAKFTQALGQALFVLLGLIFVILSADAIMSRYPAVIYTFAAFLSGILATLTIAGVLTFRYLSTNGRLGPTERDHREEKTWLAALGDVPRQCLSYFRNHPGRFVLSTLFFMCGYLWGGFEAYWICRFLGVPVSPKTALVIEVLSNFIDSVLFMVPAKVGSQEAGKTAIFVGLGLPASAGFAFGVVRHIRELAWATTGLAIYWTHKSRRAPRGNAAAPPTDSGSAAVPSYSASTKTIPSESSAALTSELRSAWRSE